MLAETLAQDHGLKMYSTLVSRGGKAISKSKLEEGNLDDQFGTNEDRKEKQKLLFILLQVYMESGKGGTEE